MVYAIAIVAAEYNADITEPMLEIAKTELEDLGAEIIKVVKVPGVLDMPLIVKKLLQKKEFDGIVAIGAVLKGGTDHDQVVAHTAMRKMVDLSVEFDKPIGFAISGPNITKEQATERIERYAKHAAETVVKQLNNLKDLQ